MSNWFSTENGDYLIITFIKCNPPITDENADELISSILDMTFVVTQASFVRSTIVLISDVTEDEIKSIKEYLNDILSEIPNIADIRHRVRKFET